jgi:hypothetical protein
MFLYHLMGIRAADAGSTQDIHSYTRVAKMLGHEVVVYGPSDTHPSFSFSMDVASADAVVFIFEWTTELRYREQLDLARVVSTVPRERRIVIDCDGAYNTLVSIAGDYNHRDVAASRLWMDICDSVSDKICQPTLHPLLPNVRPFLFYAYDPASALLLDFRAKDYGMVYVGQSRFRWLSMERVLRAIELIRERVGRICLIGHGWDALPPWATRMGIEDAYYTDRVYLEKLNVEIMPPVPFAYVSEWMSKGAFNPVLVRPIFNRLRLVTPRFFETLAANTIPLFVLHPAQVQEIYGNDALELVLPEDHPEDKISDMVCRPEHYREVLQVVRAHLAEKHSHAARFQELVEIIKE